MRIIAGKLKGRVIKTTQDNNIRPTKTKARAALFNILYSGKNLEDRENILDGAVVLDLCCGTGSLGLEALSRGAKFCYFLDQSTNVLSILEKNIFNFQLEADTKLIRADVQALPKAKEMCDLIFIDPPYKLFNIDKIIKSLEIQGWIKNRGIIVVENYFQEDLSLSLDYFKIVTERRYGKTKLIILEKNL